jgi:hypothetical protein
LIGALLEDAGGTSAFVDQWYDQLQAATRERPGSKFVLDHYRDIAKLVIELHEAQAAAIDIESMDEEETKEYLGNLLMTELAESHGVSPLSLTANQREEDDEKPQDDAGDTDPESLNRAD